MTGKTKRNKAKSALLLIDLISDFEFEDGEELFKNALPIGENLAELKKRAKKAEIPIVYVNDNYGKWQEDFKSSVKHCLQKSVRGSKLVKFIVPEEDDFYVLKPRHSAFYKTVLELLLEKLEVKKLFLTGVATDICILFTANDAYMREFEIVIVKDCVAAVKNEENISALDFMKKKLKAEIIDSKEIKF